MATKDLVFAVICLAAVMASQADGLTDRFDVKALEDLYQSLNNPPQLTGWRLDGGDPCNESWKGVLCSGSSIISLELHGLDFYGFISAGIHSLHNLKRLDISYNNITGEIPFVLPPKATYVDMACNSLINSIPQYIGGMKHLQYLNLSHNMLSGAIGNIFSALKNLKQLDLSYNNFTDLPSSFGSITDIIGLYLRNNQFPAGSLTSQSGAEKKLLVIIWIVFVTVAAVLACCMASLYVASQRGRHRIGAPAQAEQKDRTPAVIQSGNGAAVVAAAAQPEQPAIAAAVQPGQQPAVAAAAQPVQQAPNAGPAQSSSIVGPDPEVISATYISPKKKGFFDRFHRGGFQIRKGGIDHFAKTCKELMKLAFPEREVELPRRKISFINDKDEVEEYEMDDDGDEV